MSGRERTKGARGELEVVELVKAAGWTHATRNWRSGAEGFSDIAHGPPLVVIESKRTERLRLRQAWKQVQADARAAGNDVLPLLATRWSATPLEPAPWLAVTRLDAVLELLAAREFGW